MSFVYRESLIQKVYRKPDALWNGITQFHAGQPNMYLQTTKLREFSWMLWDTCLDFCWKRKPLKQLAMLTC
jgi:hypothetical protein